jgi:hypothetical protein
MRLIRLYTLGLIFILSSCDDDKTSDKVITFLVGLVVLLIAIIDIMRNNR